jgi:pyruvate formate lyase activating enzyme
LGGVCYDAAMGETREAMLFERTRDGGVRCRLCAHGCAVARGARGLCGVRENVDGSLVSLIYGRLVAREVDPIEKKPMFHFFPGSRAYSIATVGCNFTCQNCQNHSISQYPRQHGGRVVGDSVTAEDVVAGAIEAGCASIAYTYAEPTVAIEFYLEVMQRARDAGLANVWVSNGYFTHEASNLFLPTLDAINIDLKGISDEFYRHVVGANVRPVLDSMERTHDAGVWVEVTTLVIPGLNDSDDDLRGTAEAVAGISPAIPWHVSRFFPAHKMIERPPTPIATLERACRIGRASGLRYVYIGNVPGEGEDTQCPECRARVVARTGHVVRENRLCDGRCPECGTAIDGIWGPSEPGP